MEKKAKIIIVQILDALIEIKDKNIAHMDMKLENILYDSQNEEIKIIDFGFSLRAGSDYDLTKYIAGTPAYMAPESVANLDLDPYSLDIWSVGVILYKLVTGIYPFRGKSETEIFGKIKKGMFTFPETIKLSQECKQLIKSLLTVNWRSRPTAMVVNF
jgi:serine/threonine protein kinase